jgi:hypothetical protein
MVAIQQTSQVRNQGGNQLGSRAQQLLQEIAGRASTNPHLFPRIASTAGTPMVYVACYDDDRSDRDRIGPSGMTTQGFAGVIPSGSFEIRARFAPANGGLAICPVDQGGLEVHVGRNANDARELKVVVLILPKAGGRPAESSNPVFEASLAVDL